jgi:hypothetical protein
MAMGEEWVKAAKERPDAVLPFAPEGLGRVAESVAFELARLLFDAQDFVLASPDLEFSLFAVSTVAWWLLPQASYPLKEDEELLIHTPRSSNAFTNPAFSSLTAACKAVPLEDTVLRLAPCSKSPSI